MMRKSSSRNQRSGGWKVTHVVQICVLVATCVWLLYQVKHSHDEKRALQERNLMLSERDEENRVDFFMLGRKDLQGSTVVASIDNITQTEGKENKEDEEAAEQDNNQDENEAGERATGGDEIEENDQDRADEEAEGVEEFEDEEEKEGRPGNAGSSDNQDQEGSDGNSQEAREEHYKADDASSAVVRDTQEIDQETENLGTDNSDVWKENTGKEELENDGRNNGTEDASNDGELHDIPVNGESQLENSSSLMETTVVEREAEVGYLSNSTVVLESAGHIEEYDDTTSDSNYQMEQQNDSTSVEPNDDIEQQNNFAGTNGQKEEHNDSTMSEPSDQIEQQDNLTGTVRDEQLETQSLPEGVSTEKVDSATGNVTVILDSAQDQNIVNEKKTVMEENSSSENTSLEQTKKSDVNEGADESDESPNESSITDENGDAVQGEPTGSSSNMSAITEEEQDARMDLSTLPEVETMSVEGIAAE